MPSVIPKILLITHSTMSNISGGSVLLQGLVEHIPPDRLSWVAAGGSSKRIPQWMYSYHYLLFPSIIFNRIIRAVVKRLPIYRPWGWIQFHLYPRRIVPRILEFIREQEIEKLWIVARDQSIPVALQLHDKTQLPIHVTVHDDIEGHNTPVQAALLREDFRRLLKIATTSDLTSTSMQMYYENLYNAPREPLIFWNGFIKGEVPPPPEIRQRVVSIGFAGNVWAADNFRIMLQALDIVNKDRRPENFIRLEVFSERLQKHFRLKSPYLNYHGFIEPGAINERLRTCDLLYVPMSFLPNQAVLAKTSLPGKILSYMKAQVPILAHGPEYATNISFVQDHQVGITVTSQDPAVLAATLLRYEEAYEQRATASRKSRELSLGEFSPEAAWERFKSVLFRI